MHLRAILRGVNGRVAPTHLAIALVLAGCGEGGEATTSASGAGGGITGGAGGSGGASSTATSSGGAGGATTGTGGGTTTGTGGGAACPAWPTCDAAFPDPGPTIEWEHFSSEIAAGSGFANHRGRDLFLNPGDPQWLIGKFSYGFADDDIKDEQVDVWLLRDCGASWELIGSSRTTEDEEHETVEGVADSGGHVYFQVPPGEELGLGLHRVRFVVRGDNSTADLFIRVVPPGTPLFVSDVDGTLTVEEDEEYSAVLEGEVSDAHPDAAAALSILVGKGYEAMYVTARPEWLLGRTREFVDHHGFPAGIIHTTTTKSGATGQEAIDYKSGELAMLAERGLVPAWAFGNTDSDAAAYENGGIQPLDHRIFIRFDDIAYGGRRIESYTELLDELEALPSLCR